MYLSFKLAVKKILRSPESFFIQGLILFALMFTVFVSLAINNGLTTSLKDISQKYGNEVRLSPKYNLKESKQAYLEETMGESLNKLKCVEAYNYHFSVPVTSDLKHTSDYFYLLGDKDPNLQEDFTEGRVKLISGRFYDNTDVERKSAYAVISRTLSELNNLKVGSSFTISSLDKHMKKELKIIGIYDQRRKVNSDISSSISYDSIYVPIDIAQEARRNLSGNEPEDILTYISFFLDKPENIKLLIKQGIIAGLDMNQFSFNSNEYLRKRKIEIMEKTVSNLRILTITGIVISIILIMLNSSHQVKRRGEELGTLYIMGLRKQAVIRKLIMEFLVVSLMVLAAAGTTAAYGITSISNYVQDCLISEINGGSNIIVSVTDSLYEADEIRVSEIDNKLENTIFEVDGFSVPGLLGQYLTAALMIILCEALTVRVKVCKYNPFEAFQNQIAYPSGIFRKAGMYAVIGQSRNQKTALMLYMAGLLKLDNGDMSFDNTRLISEWSIMQPKEKIGFLLQEFKLLDYLTAVENITLLYEIQGMSPAASKKAVIVQLEKLGFEKVRYGVRAARLNSRERQQIMFLRAIGSNSTLIFVEADEWNAEAELEPIFMKLLDEAAHREKACVVIATNSKSIADNADEIWGIKNGILLPIKTASNS